MRLMHFVLSPCRQKATGAGGFDQREAPGFHGCRSPYLPLGSRPDVLVFRATARAHRGERPHRGHLRLRYRKGRERGEVVKPGEPVRMTITLYLTSNLFMPGYGIRRSAARAVFAEGGFTRFRRATETPFNLILEAGK
jgi:hypothetical protein